MTPPVLLVASSGGHLTQLVELEPRLGLEGPHRWVTFESPQSTSALHDADVDYVRHISPRRPHEIVFGIPRAWRILHERRPAAVVSTGAAIALAFLPLAWAMRIPTYYIESATRSQGPSLTGRLLSLFPGIRLYTQHPDWATSRWRFAGSVFEGYRAELGDPRPIRRVVVTTGTMKNYGFRALIERLIRILPPDAEVLWQTGATDVSDLPITCHTAVAEKTLRAAIVDADVVVAHAGTGTALTCVRLGCAPVLVPRRAAHGEHVDDHQQLTADYLGKLGLAIVTDVAELSTEDLELAARTRVVFEREAPTLSLD